MSNSFGNDQPRVKQENTNINTVKQEAEDVNVEVNTEDKWETRLKMIKFAAKVFVGLLVFYIVVRLVDNFSCKKHPEGLACVASNVLGEGADIALGLLKGCEKQEDCKKVKNKGDCDSKDTCKWSETNDGSCRCTTGNKPGKGGLFDIHCGLFIGFLIFGLASILTSIAGAAYKLISDRVKNRSGKEAKESETAAEKLTDESRQTGIPRDELLDRHQNQYKDAISEAERYPADFQGVVTNQLMAINESLPEDERKRCARDAKDLAKTYEENRRKQNGDNGEKTPEEQNADKFMDEHGLK